jgi:glycine/D-amino acid oxidase-like deaminating enzyme
MSDFIVVGAGVVGTSVAYRLAQAGASVTVLEAGQVGSGASGASFAWLNANPKPPRAYHNLNVAGMRAHVALRDEFGSAPWWHGGGNIEWFADEAKREAQRQKVELLRSWGYAAEWLTLAELRTLEPGIDHRAVGDGPVALYPDEGWVDGVTYAQAMLQGAQRAGATARLGVTVAGVVLDGHRVTGVKTAAGDTVSAGTVINCAGASANDAAARPDLTIPMTPTQGLLVVTRPAPTCLQRVIHAPQCHVRPDGAGRLMLHREDADHLVTATLRPTLEHPVARDVVASAAQILPALAGIEPEAVRVGVRPIPADGYPAVGPLPGVSGYYLVVSHSAVTLAPVLGEAAAGELTTGRPDARLEPFRPHRFAKVGR